MPIRNVVTRGFGNGTYSATNIAIRGYFAGIIPGGAYNGWGYFPTGQVDVIITVYDPIVPLATPVALTTNVCTEIPGTGLYLWDSSKLLVQPIGDKEYVYTMTDGVEKNGGHINVFDAENTVKLEEIHNALRLDEDNTNTVDSVIFNAGIASYNISGSFGNFLKKLLTVSKYLGLK